MKLAVYLAGLTDLSINSPWRVPSSLGQAARWQQLHISGPNRRPGLYQVSWWWGDLLRVVTQ